MNITHRIQDIRSIIKRAYKGYTPIIIFLGVLGILKALFESIGITSLIPLFALVVGQNIAGADVVSTYTEKAFQLVGLDVTVGGLLTFIFVIFFIQFVLVVWSNYLLISLTTAYEKDTRSKLFKSVLQAKWPYLMKQKLGYVENILMTDVRHAKILLRQLAMVMSVLGSVSMYLFVAFQISWRITLSTLAFAMVLFVLFKPLFSRSRSVAGKTARYNKQVAHHVNEHMLAVKSLKAAHAQKQAIDTASNLFAELKRLQIKAFLYKQVSGSLLKPVSLLFVMALFLLSYQKQGFDIAAFTVVIFLVQRVFQYVNQLQATLHSINQSSPFVAHVVTLLDVAKKEAEPELQGEAALPVFTNQLELKNISFAYNDKNVLHKISMLIPKGSYMGIVGPSGAGKTTIIDMLLRLYAPGKGKILLDGKDIQSFDLRTWRNLVGYVGQDAMLLNTTVKENISFYRDLKDEDIIAAAKKAQVHDVIMALPNQYDTVIGERGQLLSGGQRQRLILARALATNPVLLVLDEPTSALDTQTEKAVQDVLQESKGEMTIIVVAHRLTTVLDCDSIFVLQNGKITEYGEPKTLLANKKSYFSQAYYAR